MQLEQLHLRVLSQYKAAWGDIAMHNPIELEQSQDMSDAEC